MEIENEKIEKYVEKICNTILKETLVLLDTEYEDETIMDVNKFNEITYLFFIAHMNSLFHLLKWSASQFDDEDAILQTEVFVENIKHFFTFYTGIRPFPMDTERPTKLN
jgi:hypothetical protein